ncbi:ORF2-encoded protein [Apostichopus japonicus]|uniref:ORF2-encoded protein n=1 Tax=Stichopus japonicus TaxID=307972 RepID=A0A2G8KC45_STIJA|nr:ORF2-encoded protein [Apostichopus japonicus]
MQRWKQQPQQLRFGVPQGSVLGSLLFTLYMSPLGQIIRHHNLKFHQCADDNQLYLLFTKSAYMDAITSIEGCVKDIKEWFTINKLKLNDSKTEVLLIRSRFDTSLTLLTNLHIGSASVKLFDSAKNIGVTSDSSYSFKQHISSTCKSINFFLRKMAHIRKYLTEKSYKTVIHAIMSAKLDYANSLLYGLPDNQLRLLQRTQNTAVRIITRSKKFDHITCILRQLHWLPVSYRINFKIILHTYKALHGLAPENMRPPPALSDPQISYYSMYLVEAQIIWSMIVL